MVKLLGANSTLGTVVSDMNSNLLDIKNREVTEIFKDDSGTRRVIIDKDGLRTSPIGVDVVTATSDQYTFNSNQNVFKVTDTGYVDIAGDGATTTTYTIPHNKPYVPIVQGYMRTGISYVQLPTYASITRDDTAHHVYLNVYIEIYADQTNIYVLMYNSLATRAPTTGTYRVSYYLLQETAGT